MLAPPVPKQVYRNAACDPSLPLASSYDGKTTLLETFEATVAQSPDLPFLGHRPIDMTKAAAAKGGQVGGSKAPSAETVALPYEWMTYRYGTYREENGSALSIATLPHSPC